MKALASTVPFLGKSTQAGWRFFRCIREGLALPAEARGLAERRRNELPISGPRPPTTNAGQAGHHRPFSASLTPLDPGQGVGSHWRSPLELGRAGCMDHPDQARAPRQRFSSTADLRFMDRRPRTFNGWLRSVRTSGRRPMVRASDLHLRRRGIPTGAGFLASLRLLDGAELHSQAQHAAAATVVRPTGLIARPPPPLAERRADAECVLPAPARQPFGSRRWGRGRCCCLQPLEPLAGLPGALSHGLALAAGVDQPSQPSFWPSGSRAPAPGGAAPGSLG